MAHEEEQEQYESDCHDHKKAWHLWQIRANGTEQWVDLTGPPAWDEDFEYRRIEPQFQPECFSGLNWQEALKKGLVGREVEFSDCGDGRWTTGTLIEIVDLKNYPFRYKSKSGFHATYIRTLPETHQHPTITIGGVKLPRPEVEAPEEGDIYYHVDSRNIVWQKIWENNTIDNGYLNASRVHLTKARAQEWADWWQDTVVKAVQYDWNRQGL